MQKRMPELLCGVCVIFCVVADSSYLLVACIMLYYVFYDVIKVSCS